jgi:hypothetical protein
MGYEWRIFLKSNQEEFEKEEEDENEWENRLDIYFIIGEHLNYGIKLRDEKKFEIKLKTARDKSGTERWTKLISTTINNIDFNDFEKTKEILLEEFKDMKDTNLITFLESLKNSKKHQKVNVLKKRKNIGNIEDCKLKIEKNNQIFYYKSYNIEGYDINNQKIKKFKSKLNIDVDIIPLGFPQFLYELN